MYIGRVSGTVVATIKNELFVRRKLLVVDKLDVAGQPTTQYDIAVDMVQAGVGDLVLVLDEGNSARQIVDREPLGAIRVLEQKSSRCWHPGSSGSLRQFFSAYTAP